MNDQKFDEAIARGLRMRGRNADAISTIILLPFAASAYASIWSFAWRLIS